VHAGLGGVVADDCRRFPQPVAVVLLYFAAVCATRRRNVERGESPLRWAVVAAWSTLGQPDPRTAGEGGKQPRQCRGVLVLPDGGGSAS
jgi:hypothetical protein